MRPPVSGERFDKEFELVGLVRRDPTSTVGWYRDRATRELGLVRRLVATRRADVEARAALVAEAEYLRRVAPRAGLAADARTLEDGELYLLYDDSGGVELSRVLLLLDAAGFGLTPAAAIVCVSELVAAVITLSRQAPPLVDGEFGHGELTPDAVLLGSDGFARAHDARFLVSGEPPDDTRGRRLCTAPELEGSGLRGTPTGDVYAIGALVAALVFGEAELSGIEPLDERVRRAAEQVPAPLSQPFVSAIARAVSTEPAQRFGSVDTLRAALRLAVEVDLEQWRGVCGALAEVADALRAVPRGETLEPGRLEALVAALAAQPTVLMPRRAEPPRRLSLVPRRPTLSPRPRADTLAEAPIRARSTAPPAPHPLAGSASAQRAPLLDDPQLVTPPVAGDAPTITDPQLRLAELLGARRDAWPSDAPDRSGPGAAGATAAGAGPPARPSRPPTGATTASGRPAPRPSTAARAPTFPPPAASDEGVAWWLVLAVIGVGIAVLGGLALVGSSPR
jgi:hypothetical protein